MKWFRGFCLVIILSILGVANVYAGEDYCAGYHSPGNSYSYCNSNPKGKGNCVWWSAYKRPELNFIGRFYGKRHGKTWLDYAKKFGFIINYDYPVAGAIVVFDRLGSYGHVAYVSNAYMGPFLPGKAPFDVSEMGYSWFDGVSTSTYRATSAYKYQRYNATKAKGFKNPTQLAGFIYPTRTIRHPNGGRLVLMRNDGQIPQSCNNVHRAVLYLKNQSTGKIDVNFVSHDVCDEAVTYYGEMVDANLGVYLKNHSGEISFGGIGGGYTPLTANYTLTPENGYGNTPQNESYLDPNHKHAISMDDTELSIRGQEW